VSGEILRANRQGLAHAHPDVFLDPLAPVLAPEAWPSREATSRAILEGQFTVDGAPYSNLSRLDRVGMAVDLSCDLRADLEAIARDPMSLRQYRSDGGVTMPHDVDTAWKVRLRAGLAAVSAHLEGGWRRPWRGVMESGPGELFRISRSEIPTCPEPRCARPVIHGGPHGSRLKVGDSVGSPPLPQHVHGRVESIRGKAISVRGWPVSANMLSGRPKHYGDRSLGFRVRVTHLRICESCDDLFAARDVDAHYCRSRRCTYTRDQRARNLPPGTA
jgi:hypothetical protein